MHCMFGDAKQCLKTLYSNKNISVDAAKAGLEPVIAACTVRHSLGFSGKKRQKSSKMFFFFLTVLFVKIFKFSSIEQTQT